MTARGDAKLPVLLGLGTMGFATDSGARKGGSSKGGISNKVIKSHQGNT